MSIALVPRPSRLPRPAALAARLAVAAALLVAVAGVLPAGRPAAAGAEGAEVQVTEHHCTLFDGDGNIVAGDFFEVVTNNGDGTGVARCQARVAPPAAGEAVTYAHFRCSTRDLGVTTRSRETVSASGQATLTCHFPAA